MTCLNSNNWNPPPPQPHDGLNRVQTLLWSLVGDFLFLGRVFYFPYTSQTFCEAMDGSYSIDNPPNAI